MDNAIKLEDIEEIAETLDFLNEEKRFPALKAALMILILN
jgi:hypothetical protein